MPELRAAFGIAIGAFLLHPHRGRENEIGRACRHRRIGVRHDDEIVGIAIAEIGFFVLVRRRLEVVVDLHPIGVEQAILQHPVLQHGVVARLVADGAFGKFPDAFGDIAMRLVGHHQIGRQAVREGADLARGAASRGLAGERERAVARLGDFSRQQMDIVDQIVAPDAAGVLVEAHGPEAGDLDLRVGIELGQRLEPVGRHAGHRGGFLDRVVRDELGVFLERDVGGVVCLAAPGGFLLQRMLGTKPIADVGLAALEQRVLGDEVLVDAAGLDDVVGDGVEQVQIGVRLEHHADVGEIERAVLEGRQHRDAHMRRAQPSVGDPRPQNRVHLRHIGAP